MPTSTADKLSSTQVTELTAQLTYGTWRRQKGWKPLYVVDAEGCYFVDVTGKKYLDFSAQLMCGTLGHKNRAVVEAIKQQAEELAFIGPGYATQVKGSAGQFIEGSLTSGPQ
jgi:taurine--2-oxoglutarate transaminase